MSKVSMRRFLTAEIRHEREIRQIEKAAVDHERELRRIADDHERELRTIAEAAVEKARGIQFSEYERRLGELNNAHERELAERSRTLPRELFESYQKEAGVSVDRVAADLAIERRRADRLEGAISTWRVIAAILGLPGIAALVLGVLAVFGTPK